MNEKRFVDHDTSVEDYMESLENMDTKEPSSLRRFVSSTERHLMRNNYTKSIINDKEFKLFRKCLQATQKELKKAGRGNKGKAAVAITDEEVDILYENNMLGVSLLNHCCILFG